MDPNRFIAQKQESWQRLERLLDKVESAGFRSLSAQEAHTLGRLYRRLASDLATAQAQIASRELELYLNALMSRAFPLLYRRPRQAVWSVMWDFFKSFPRLLHSTASVHVLAAAIFMAGAFVGYLSYSFDPQASIFFRPGRVDLFERTAKEGKIGGAGTNYATLFSTKIMTNNIRVAFLAFALGLTFGVGTVIILFYNGLLLGTYAAVAHKYGLAVRFWSLILPHGILELSAIFLAGGAGFLLARGLLFPQEHTRQNALRKQAKSAMGVIYGVIPMLVIAGLIEGFVTPSAALIPEAKLGFAMATLAALVWYLMPRKSLEQSDAV